MPWWQVPLCTRRLLVRRDEGAVNKHVLEVELIRQHVEDTLDDTRKSPAAEPLEQAVPVAELRRKARHGDPVRIRQSTVSRN